MRSDCSEKPQKKSGKKMRVRGASQWLQLKMTNVDAAVMAVLSELDFHIKRTLKKKWHSTANMLECPNGDRKKVRPVPSFRVLPPL